MENDQQRNRKDWPTAHPQKLPQPTYFPFLFALSVAFFLWGLVSLWLMAIAGLTGMGISIAGWINNLLYERDSDS